jgi:hypothetical protein
MKRESRVTTFASTYVKAFSEIHPSVSAVHLGRVETLAITFARGMHARSAINGPAFDLTAQRLNIECTARAFLEYLEGR